MRRKLAFILLSAAVLFGGAATIASTITSLDTDVTYGAGRDLYFRISEEGSTINGVFPEDYISDDGYQAVDAVANEMEDRLAHWDIEGSVEKEGYNTIKVTIRSQSADDTEYSYLQRYLSFSGGNFSLLAGSSDEDIVANAPSFDSFRNNQMFDGQEADIRYLNNIPVVTIGVNQPGEDGELAQLIDYCEENTTAADSSAGTEGSTTYLTLWANYQEGDSFARATDTEAEDWDPNMSSRLLFGANATQCWWDDTDDDLDYTRLQIVPNSTAIESGQFDESKAGAAYKAALYYESLLNASSYADIGAGYDVTFAYSTIVPATVENLVTAGDWHLTPALSNTLIASACALLVGIVISAAFYRLSSLAILSNGVITLMGALLLLSYFGAQFGIGMLLGLVLSLLISFFGTSYYLSKVKEALYNGRTSRKAHQEAMKKTFWPVLDASIGGILIGVCIYSLIPGAFSYFGLALVLGSFFAAAGNLLYVRLLGKILAGDESASTKVLSVYGADPMKLPERDESGALVLKEGREGPFAKVPFEKGKVVSSILYGALTLASIVGLSTFAALDANGEPYSFGAAYENQTVLALEYRVPAANQNTLLAATIEQIKEDYLPLISLDGTAFDAADWDITLEETSIYDSLEEMYYNIYYFTIDVPSYFDPATEYSFTVEGQEYTSLQDASTAAADALAGEELTAMAQDVRVTSGLPTFANVWLGFGVGVVALFAYLLLRFRPSKGISAALLILASSLLPIGIISLCRIPVTTTINLAAIVTGFITYLYLLLPLNKERELRLESREKDKRSLAFREEMLKRGVKESAFDLFLLSGTTLGVTIFYFGLGPGAFEFTFLFALLGALLALPLVLLTFEPLSTLLARLFAKIRVEFRKDRESGHSPRGNDVTKKKSAEPEEAIFIGIND